MRAVFFMSSSGEGTREGVVYDEEVLKIIQGNLGDLEGMCFEPTFYAGDREYSPAEVLQEIEARTEVGIGFYENFVKAYDHGSEQD